MSRSILGIHHVTAICGEPQDNIDFYAGVLGLRLVKITVNYDDPSTYHLYYGDGQGSPGTIITFFPWPHAGRGTQGNGQVTVTSFAAPKDSLAFWQDRLTASDVSFDGPIHRFGDAVISFKDPDGLRLEIVATEHADADRAWLQGPIPAEAALRGFHSATISQISYEATARLLQDTMGFEFVGQEDSRFRYKVGDGAAGKMVDLLCAPGVPFGHVAVGTVHHIAWRTPDDESEGEWLDLLYDSGHHVSPVMDRTYFHSIYYREPGGVLFEIATDNPGFAVDEPADDLGSGLVLPATLESRRKLIEARLPKITLPARKAGGQA